MKSTDLPVFGGIDTIYESDIDDDNYSGAENPDILERRRKSHTEAEQRRRNAIKRGFETLRELVYPLKSNGSSARLSKLLILNKSVTEIRKLVQETNQKDLDVSTLERTAETLRLTTAFYGSRVQQVSSTSASLIEPIGEEPKLKIFELLSGGLFSSFNSFVNVSSFHQFAEDYLNWLEEICSREVLYRLVESIIPEVISLEPETSPEAAENRHPMNALCTPRMSTGFVGTKKLFTESDRSKWDSSGQYASVGDNVQFSDTSSKHFLCEVKHSPAQSTFPTSFSSSVQRMRSYKNSIPDPTQVLHNASVFDTPSSSRESVLKSIPYDGKSADEFIASDSSISPATHSRDSQHMKAQRQNPYPSAIFAGSLRSMPSSLAIPESTVFRNPRASFQPFD